jgi:hypothetical protein
MNINIKFKNACYHGIFLKDIKKIVLISFYGSSSGITKMSIHVQCLMITDLNHDYVKKKKRNIKFKNACYHGIFLKDIMV